ncbi:MAG: hypothetical protein KBF35_00570 [Saprospiraceae bacterium]|nr:hypothetical protein [Saprospiraceae bacterium]
MKVFNRNFLLVAVSFFVLYYCSVNYFENNNYVSFLDASFMQIFNEFELPSWLMIILGVVILMKLIKVVSASLLRTRNYILMYIALVFVMTSCTSGLFSSCAAYPSIEDWNEECDDEPYFPYTAYYNVSFLASEVTLFPEPVEGVNVECIVTRWQRLSHPNIPDSCYFSTNLVTTLVGTTDANGVIKLPFEIEFTSNGDYFILEGSFEKPGYSRELFSRDERWYLFNDEYVPCSAQGLHSLLFRDIGLRVNLAQFSASP